MRGFLKTVALGAALTAGIISLFQCTPFLIFVKRVGITFLAFYLIGIGLDVLWNAASIYIEKPRIEGGRDEAGDGGEGAENARA